jgi:3-phosphoshikimate 1-carboxyvinyltransferase
VRAGARRYDHARQVQFLHPEVLVAVQHDGTSARVTPAGPLAGPVDLPGSKSLSNRLLACAALADGESQLRRISVGEDTRRMAAGLRALGVKLQVAETSATATLTGCGGFLPVVEADVDAGAAGTAMRFLTALACLSGGRCRLDGSPRMRERPIGPLVEGLRGLGARIGYEHREGYPPVTVLGGGLSGGEVAFHRPPSSQFISALLMVAPYAARDVLIRIDGPLPSRPYVDMTTWVMRALGVEVLESEGPRFVVPAGQRFRGGRFEVEPDASAATYFWAAAAITGGRTTVPGLSRDSAQGDAGFVDILGRMRCTVVADETGLGVQGPPAGVLRGGTFDLNDMPDAAQTLAVTAMFAAGPTSIRNVANLRIKETDRLAALGAELSKLGASVEVHADGLTITPPAEPRSAEIDTYDDHRMAMSFALAGLRIRGGVVIRDAGCVAKSFPGFFETLARLTG